MEGEKSSIYERKHYSTTLFYMQIVKKLSQDPSFLDKKSLQGREERNCDITYTMCYWGLYN